MRPIVLVMKDDPNKDMTLAEEYGRVEYLFTRGEVKEHELLKPRWIQAQTRDRAKVCTFDPDRDYVLPVGGPALLALTLSALLQHYHRLRLLCWNRDRYYVVHINPETV